MLTKCQLIYDYLLNNCVGYENRIKGYQLMKLFKINDHKTFRSYIQEIRQSPDFPKLIGSEAGSNGGYFVISNYDEYKTTIDHHYLRAMEMLKTKHIMEQKYLNENMEKLEV